MALKRNKPLRRGNSTLGGSKGINRKSKHRTPTHTLKELKDAEDFGGQRVKGSGNQWHSPGDVQTTNFLIDSKLTKHKSYSIKNTTWDKISKEARLQKKLPALSIELGTGHELVVLNKQDLLALVEELKTLKMVE